MPRRPALERLDDLIETATQLFIQKGYRRTQMADVTQAMGLSPGAIYRYVESKEALFDLVVRAAAPPGATPADLTLPLLTPPPGATLAFVRQVLQHEGRLPALDVALTRTRIDAPRAELACIIRELYTLMARYHRGIKVVERSALDWPDLAALWFGDVRQRLLDQFTRYLTLRTTHRLLRPVPDVTAAARLIIETTAFFALHRHYDPYPLAIDDRIAEETVVDALINAYAIP
jgi:AcrR family transcriptional regulator